MVSGETQGNRIAGPAGVVKDEAEYEDDDGQGYQASRYRLPVIRITCDSEETDHRSELGRPEHVVIEGSVCPESRVYGDQHGQRPASHQENRHCLTDRQRHAERVFGLVRESLPVSAHYRTAEGLFSDSTPGR